MPFWDQVIERVVQIAGDKVIEEASGLVAADVLASYKADVIEQAAVVVADDIVAQDVLEQAVELLVQDADKQQIVDLAASKAADEFMEQVSEVYTPAF